MLPRGSRPRDFFARTETLRRGRERTIAPERYDAFELEVKRAVRQVRRWFEIVLRRCDEGWWNVLMATGRAAQGLEDVRIATRKWTGGSIACPPVPREHRLIRSAQAAVRWDEALIRGLLAQWSLQARLADPLLEPVFDPVSYARYAVLAGIVADVGHFADDGEEELTTAQLPSLRARPYKTPVVFSHDSVPEPIVAEGSGAQLIQLPWHRGSQAPTPRVQPVRPDVLRRMKADAAAAEQSRKDEWMERCDTDQIPERRGWRRQLAVRRRPVECPTPAEVEAMLRMDTVPPEER